MPRRWALPVAPSGSYIYCTYNIPEKEMYFNRAITTILTFLNSPFPPPECPWGLASAQLYWFYCCRTFYSYLVLTNARQLTTCQVILCQYLPT